MATLIYQDENGNSKEIPIHPDKSLLEMLEEAGIDYPFSCMAGACSSCRIIIHKGKDKLALDKFGTPLMPVEDNELLTCVCGIEEAIAKDPDVVIELEKVKD